MPDAAAHPPHDPKPVLDAAPLRGFLPLIYIAWADGELSDDELRAICGHAAAAGLDAGCEQIFGRWLDPAAPPTPEAVQELLAAIRRGADELSAAERLSIVELGVELARADGHQPGPAERQALTDIANLLGLAPATRARQLLARERPEVAASEPEPAFDGEALARLLEGGRHELRREVRELLASERFARRYGLSKEAYREQVLAWCRELAERGYGSLSLPAAAGGADDVEGFVAVFETLGYHDLSLLVKFGVQFGLFAGSVHQLGSEHHHAHILPAAGSLALPGCFAMTETGHGSNVHDLETVATYDPASGEFVIETPRPQARKDYIGNAARDGRMATVFAQLDTGGHRHGVHAFLVPIRDADGAALPGVDIEDCGEKLGLNGVDNGRLSFDRVRVPRSCLLDRFGQVAADGTYSSGINSPSKRFFTMLGTLVGGRVSIALAAGSASKSALAIAVRYAERRRQFGPAGEAETLLLDYSSHQRRLLPRLATTYALGFALHHLVERYVATLGETDRRAVETLAAGIKAFSTWHATDTIQACREACGGKGYLAVNRFAALKADTDVFTTFEGDNTVLLQLVAKGLLTRYKKQFGDLDLLGLARYLAGQAATLVAELNPVITRRTDPAHLRDRDFQLGALAWRRDHLLSTVARRLKKRIDAGAEPHDALNACQNHLLATAKAHVEHLVLERFAEAVDALADEAVRGVLTSLRDLYALHRIELDRGWFLEHHYLEAAKAKAIRKEVERLCREVRPHARLLVDAFGIPDVLLAAPIAVETG